MELCYFDIQHALSIQSSLITSSGGLQGIAKRGQLEAILDFVQNDQYYPEFEQKLTYLFYAINTGHCFIDGNKRSSIALSSYFLALNNFGNLVGRFIEQMENIAVDVADNRVSRDLLGEIMFSIIYEMDYSEELKLKIIHAKMS